MSPTFDALIIGGGVHGASLAFHLACRGLKPAVLEKSFIAAGATGRSSGLVRMHYDLLAEAHLAHISFSYFTDWAARVGGECGFTRTGFLQFVSPDQVDALRANVTAQQNLGINTQLITADELCQMVPEFRTEDLEFVAWEPDSGYADPSMTAGSLMTAAKAQGATFLGDCTVQGIDIVGGRVTGIQTSKGAFSTPIVVNAAGAWAKQVCEMAGLDLPLSTWRHETMFIRRPASSSKSLPTVIDFPNMMYFRPEGRDLTLVGLEDGNPLGESPDRDADRARPGFVERAIDRICRRIPAMESASLHSAHGGYDGITPDQHPALGPLGPDGFWLDTGFSGTGFKIAPAVGLCMAEWIIDGKPSSVDISIFSPTRLLEGRHILGEHPYESIWR